ncbi:MAG: acyl-CoA-binding protein [Myxococcota bacterium]
MSLEESFQAAVVRSRALPAQTPAGLLALYGLYKQATDGDATGARPGMLDVRGRAKHDAWAGRAGQSREAAMQEYIDTVDRLGGGGTKGSSE